MEGIVKLSQGKPKKGKPKSGDPAETWSLERVECTNFHASLR